MQRLAGLVVSTIAIVGALSPVAVLAKVKPSAGSKDQHDCRQLRGGNTPACHVPPQSGPTFAVRQPLIGAVRSTSATPLQVVHEQGSITRLGKIRPGGR